MKTLSGAAVDAAAPGATHCRRLREIYRSAGWPCQDAIEIELLAHGLLERVRTPSGHETVRLTEAGIALVASRLQTNRARLQAHEQLVEHVARTMTRAGRLAWRGLRLRAKVGAQWVMAMPDVFSIRHTTVEAYVEPIVHEVKVQRSDLLSDLRKPDKRAAYAELGGECWYVIREGIARPDEIPPECGVLVSNEAGLEVARAAPRRAARMTLAIWMALARATPLDGWRFEEEAQTHLGDASTQTGDPCDT